MRTARLETVLQWQYIKCLTDSPAYRPLSGISILSYAIHSLNVTLGGPQMNKFEQVSSDDHQMSPAGGWGKGVPGLMSRGLGVPGLMLWGGGGGLG